MELDTHWAVALEPFLNATPEDIGPEGGTVKFPMGIEVSIDIDEI